jgi:undecaprenyl-diphosphatase
MDVSVVRALYQWASSAATLDSLVVLVAQAGIFVLPVVLLAAWFVDTAPADRRRQAVVVGCVAAVFAVAVGLTLERLLHRPRPFVELGLTPLFPHADVSSFPSDHTLVAFALVGPLVWGAPRWGVWLAGWALIMGFARVAAGVHYPSAIIGSAVLALIIDGVVWFAMRPVLARFNLQRWDAGLRDSPRGARPR